MSKIRIKNFGPIKEGFDSEDGFMDIKKVTVFIGDQGTGKSTVAKLISTLTWLEKAINRKDEGLGIGGMHFGIFRRFFEYQVIENYFLPDTEFDYIGERCTIHYNRKKAPFPTITYNSQEKYSVPQIIYVSSERNFLTTIKNAYEVKNLPGHLFTFAEELKRTQKTIVGQKVPLPIKGYDYEYVGHSDKSIIHGANYEIELFEASSGLQSAVPLYLVSKFLSNSIASDILDYYGRNLSVTQSIKRNEEIAALMLDEFMSDEEKKIKLNEISSRYINKCFINIVEEPEQNLFPTSQRHMLNSLLEFCNMTEGNKLIMTTHSPYILSYLSLAVQGNTVLGKINEANKYSEMIGRLEDVIPVKSVISGDDLVVYQLKDDGSISLLPDYEGIPADSNYLNKSLMESNQLFDKLLDIEEDL